MVKYDHRAFAFSAQVVPKEDFTGKLFWSSVIRRAPGSQIIYKMERSTADPQAAGEESEVLIPHSGQEDDAEKASAPRHLSSVASLPEPSQPSTVVEITAAATNSVWL